MGHECTWEDRELRRNCRLPVTLKRYKAARERLIQSRATHLDQLIFDHCPDRPWEEKLWQRTERIGQRTIGVWGM
ncbi:hypothetical protein [Caldichromatium japonicum]|uniref:hypothetical protein n=1 Tax=Caldichromatium japonicum TaxID=2699430 RepID=UPI001B355BE1|nr:hypothetical protein [Caldichromatium japonicum]